jgi:hypothetical protein
MKNVKQATLPFLRIVAAMALGGLIAVGWTIFRGRRGRPHSGRGRRFGHATLAVALVVVAGGAITRAVAAVDAHRACRVQLPPNSIDHTQQNTAVGLTEEAATWVPTGVALWYPYAFGRVCWIPRYRFFVGVNTKLLENRSMTVGNVLLRPERAAKLDPVKVGAVTAHESRHRPQWAVATVLGGPLAFPVVYTITDLFFPDARNPFERMAGLRAGNYNPYSKAEPVLHWPQIGALAVVAVTAEVLYMVVLPHHRRALALLTRQQRREGSALGPPDATDA